LPALDVSTAETNEHLVAGFARIRPHPEIFQRPLRRFETRSKPFRNSSKTGGDCPNFAESSQQNGTVPLSETVLLEFLKPFSATLLHLDPAPIIKVVLVTLRGRTGFDRIREAQVACRG
jgi:hypothetical protein